MRKKIVIFTTIILVLSIFVLGFQIFRYYSEYPVSKIEREIHRIEDKTDKVESEVNKLDEEKNKLAEENKEKVEILDLWEKAIKEINI